jgi:hypothetical protein
MGGIYVTRGEETKSDGIEEDEAGYIVGKPDVGVAKAETLGRLSVDFIPSFVNLQFENESRHSALTGADA